MAFSEDYLNRHADDFAAMCLHLHDITLLQYLACPEHYQSLALEPFPLLPKQVAVSKRLEKDQTPGVGFKKALADMSELQVGHHYFVFEKGWFFARVELTEDGFFCPRVDGKALLYGFHPQIFFSNAEYSVYEAGVSHA